MTGPLRSVLGIALLLRLVACQLSFDGLRFWTEIATHGPMPV